MWAKLFGKTIFSGFLALVVMVGAGCDNPGGTRSGVLFAPKDDGKERWTIRCRHSTAPDHAAQCNNLADLLRKVSGLSARKVRVVSGQTGSTIYYSEYVKVASATGELIFPADFRREIELIRQLAYNEYTPFFGAQPELVDADKTLTRGQWDISRAKGRYSLQIAVFYNTPTFHKRREAAEQYVQLLRQEGYSAYYRHEVVKSHVFVGDFDQSTIVQTPAGPRFGPVVEKFIARRPDEFKNISENGHLRKHIGPEGQSVAPLSYLVPVPRDENAWSTGG